VRNLKAGHSAADVFDELTNIQEKERKRIAFDLHDGPAQSISSALLQIGIMEVFIDADDLKKEFIELKNILKSTLKELHNIICPLRGALVYFVITFARFWQEGVIGDLPTLPAACTAVGTAK